MQSKALRVETKLEIEIGDWMVFMENIRRAPSATSTTIFFVYVESVDDAYRSAMAHGATSIAEPADKRHVERSAKVKDTVGNMWSFYTFNMPAAKQLIYGSLSELVLA